MLSPCALPDAWLRERSDLVLLIDPDSKPEQTPIDMAWLPGWATEAFWWVESQPLFQRLLLVREQMIRLVVYLDLLSFIAGKMRRPASLRSLLHKLEEHGLQCPSWAWSLVGLDGSMSEVDLRRGMDLPSGGRLCAVEGWLLAEMARGHGPLLVDDPELLTEILGALGQKISSDANRVHLCVRIFEDGIESSVCPLATLDTEDDLIEVILHKDALAALSQGSLIEDWCAYLGSCLRLAMRPVLADLLAPLCESARPSVPDAHLLVALPWATEAVHAGATALPAVFSTPHLPEE